MEFLPEQQYPRAPITEAVIDLSLAQGAEPSVETLRSVSDGGYPHQDPLLFGQVQFAPSTATATQGTLGWRNRSADGHQIYQARVNGFGISRLAPYQSWVPFAREARRLWTLYQEVVGQCALQRLGVRYINRIDIPLPLDDFGDYLRTAPVVSEHLPQGLSHYLMSVTIPIDEVVNAVVTEAILPASAPSGKPDTGPIVSLLLDIDVSQAVSIPENMSDVWDRFEHLRRVKNHVFEACITDKTRELFR